MWLFDMCSCVVCFSDISWVFMCVVCFFCDFHVRSSVCGVFFLWFSCVFMRGACFSCVFMCGAFFLIFSCVFMRGLFFLWFSCVFMCILIFSGGPYCRRWLFVDGSNPGPPAMYKTFYKTFWLMEKTTIYIYLLINWFRIHSINSSSSTIHNLNHHPHFHFLESWSGTWNLLQIRPQHLLHFSSSPPQKTTNYSSEGGGSNLWKIRPQPLVTFVTAPPLPQGIKILLIIMVYLKKKVIATYIFHPPSFGPLRG